MRLVIKKSIYNDIMKSISDNKKNDINKSFGLKVKEILQGKAV